MFKKLLLTTVFALTLPQAAFAQNDITGVVGEYFVRTSEGGGDGRFYFRLSGGVASSQLDGCMAGQPEHVTWDIDVGTGVAAEMMAMVKRSREEGKQIRVLGMHNVCAGGQSQTGDTVFEIVPNWQPGS